MRPRAIWVVTLPSGKVTTRSSMSPPPRSSSRKLSAEPSGLQRREPMLPPSATLTTAPPGGSNMKTDIGGSPTNGSPTGQSRQSIAVNAMRVESGDQASASAPPRSDTSKPVRSPVRSEMNSVLSFGSMYAMRSPSGDQATPDPTVENSSVPSGVSITRLGSSRTPSTYWITRRMPSGAQWATPYSPNSTCASSPFGATLRVPGPPSLHVRQLKAMRPLRTTLSHSPSSPLVIQPSVPANRVWYQLSPSARTGSPMSGIVAPASTAASASASMA